ncbi:helix-turn-helix domain-containing protein [Microbacterium sp. K41]|uniref:helix-turn-helix domain-containing protein n=1 Tax=Microbacterium sp. K41 TaxID=2305437 RepID=UPI00109CBB30|nr:helix-turn-helix domain-containing protein [Microbacterium sp. K41]
MDFSDLVAGAVRAELARAKKKPADLADVLGLSRPTIYGRISGAYPFTTAELEQVASFIGITAQDIMLSAALPESFGGGRLSEVAPLSAGRVEAWAQPPGSSRRPQRL